MILAKANVKMTTDNKSGEEKILTMSTIGNKELALKAAKILSSKKAMDIVVIDVSEKSSFADYFVIASGNTERQVGSLADEVEDQLAKDEVLPKNIEGKPGSGWILMDYGDVIISVFQTQQREKYQIENIWGDGNFIDSEEYE